MKKLMSTLILGSMLLVGCSPSIKDMEERNESRNSDFIILDKLSEFVFVVKDKNTGCQYIQSQSSDMYYQYSPYYKEDGKVGGCGEK